MLRTTAFYALLGRKKIPLLILQLVIWCAYYVIIHSYLQYLFSSPYNVFKSWYPNYYLLAFVSINSIVAGLLTLQSFLIIQIFQPLKSSSHNTHLTISLSVAFYGVFHLINSKVAIVVALVLFFILLVYQLSEKIWAALVAIYYYRNTKLLERIIVLLVFGAIAYRLFFAWQAENALDGDASCRFYIAHLWAKYFVPYGSPLLIVNPNIDWLPLHFYLTGMFWDISHSERFVLLCHGIAGIFGGVFIAKIARLLFNNVVRWITLLFYMIYPAGVATSSSMLSEPWFILFMAMGFFYFLNYMKEEKKVYLYVHVFSMMMAALLRFEAWPMLLFFPLFDFTKRAFTLHRSQLCYGLYLIVPVVVMYLTYLQGFSPFRGIAYSDVQVKQCYDITGRTLDVLVEGYRFAWIPGLFLCFALWFLNARKTSVQKKYVIILLMFMFPYLIKVCNYTLMPHDRYLVKYVVFFLPFWGYMTLGFSKSRLFLSVIIAALSSSFVLFGLNYNQAISFKYPKGFQENIQYFERLQKGNLIVDHHRALRGYSWLALTDLPLDLDYHDWYLSQFIPFDVVKERIHKEGIQKKIKYIVNDADSEMKTINYNLVDSITNAHRDLYLVFFPEGPLNEEYKFSKEVESRHDVLFKKMYDFADYRIYRKIEVQ